MYWLLFLKHTNEESTKLGPWTPCLLSMLSEADSIRGSELDLWDFNATYLKQSPPVVGTGDIC